eukprot:gene5089-749_t
MGDHRRRELDAAAGEAQQQLDASLVDYFDANAWRNTRGRVKWFDGRRGRTPTPTADASCEPGAPPLCYGVDAFFHKTKITYGPHNPSAGMKCSFHVDGERDGKLAASHVIWLQDDDPVAVADDALRS